MCKLKELFLMLCLILSGAFCYASGMAGTENGKESDGVPIDLKESTGLSGLDKSNSIIATLNDNVLIVVFTENLGEVSVEITTSTGGYVQANSCITPNGLMFYIPFAGDYIVTFTLPNGDEYYGEFTVTD
jgi:hypothetical protein